MKKWTQICCIFAMTSCISLHLASAQNEELPTSPKLDQANDIRAWLVRVADEVTHHTLDGIETLEDWKNVRDQRYDEMVEMLSLTDVPLEGERPPLNPVITGEVQQDGYKIVKLYYESLPDLYVPANLYIPDNITQPVPGILYVCGHSMTQKVRYQAHPRKFAQLGFVCLIIETIQRGEVEGMHWGCYAEGQFQWYSRGYTPGGVELWNSIRGLDLLASIDKVDGERLGVTGISGGGAYSWFVGAIDPRVDAVAPVCGTGTVDAHVYQRTLDGHCDCMMHVNTYLRDVHDLAALIAPRPLMVASANRDGIFSIESIRDSFGYMKKIYDLYDASDNLHLVETPGPHSYHETSRTKIFSFFLKHLMDKNVPPEEVGDIDESDEAMLSADTLRVYVDGPPPDDRTTTIQESFQKMAEAPEIGNQDDLEAHRKEVIQFLKEKTFRAFPENPVPLDTRLVFRGQSNNGGHNEYSFVPEEGFRLKMEWHWSDETAGKKAPVVLVIKSPQEGRWDSNSFVSGLDDAWNRAFLEVRGVGEVGWSPELQWHIRRAAAWSGRTIASMRVYDVLRALEALRQLENVDGEKIALAARGEMAVIALYAALLDGNVHTVLIQDAPPTQNAPGEKDGRGPAIEMLNCLRVTDLPYLAGILAPTQVRFVREPHNNYQWAMDIQKKLGNDDAVEVIPSISRWNPGE